MEFGTTIIGISLMLVCMLPFAIIIFNRSQRERQFLKNLNDFALINNCKISEHELSNNAAFGIDNDTFNLFYIKKQFNEYVKKEVSLAEIKKCRVINSSREVKSKNGSYKVIDKLSLAFSYADKNKPEVLLECYNADIDGDTINGELILAEKWSKKVNTTLSSKQKK